jgi:TolB-like protein
MQSCLPSSQPEGKELMITPRFLRFFGAVIPLLLAGCAATVDYFQAGRTQLGNREYDAAIRSFAAAKRANPGDRAVLRETGIAYFGKNKPDSAKPLLLEAFIKDTTDGRALFYLGMTFESLGDYPHAVDIYRRYADTGADRKIRDAVEARLTGLMRKEMEEEAKSALAGEAALNPATLPDNTVAVLYFKNLGKNRELDPIQKGLADMMITDLSKVKALSVVERVRMQKMIEEMGLGQTGLVDEATSPRMGKLVGAARLIQGSFTDLAKESVRLDAGVVQVKAGKAVEPQKIQGRMANFFKMEKDLVFGILNRMAVPLSQAEKDEIRVIPTENLLAFIAYCRGLDFEDKGMLRESRQEYKKATFLDPQFQQAKEGVNRAEALTAAQLSISALEEVYARASGETPSETVAQAPVPKEEEKKQARRETSAETAAAAASPPLVDQMMRTAGVIDQGFLPGIDSRSPSQEQNKPSFGNSAGFDIRVDVPWGE